MKTVYILHGGVVKWQTEANKRYYQEMIKGLNRPKVLLVYFAREDKEIPELAQRDQANFTWANPGTKITYSIASESNFASQVRENDTIFFAGGKTSKLLNAVKQDSYDLKHLFEGKIVSGSSAGAHLIAEWFYGHREKKISQGLGLLPISVFTHYLPDAGSEFCLPPDVVEKIENDLSAKAADGAVVRLPEQHMEVYR